MHPESTAFAAIKKRAVFITLSYLFKSNQQFLMLNHFRFGCNLNTANTNWFFLRLKNEYLFSNTPCKNKFNLI